MAVSARELTLILRVQSAGSNNIRRMAADLNSLERGGQSFAQRFKTASQSIGAVGRQMQLIGGIGTFALGLAANQAATLQTQVSLAATQVTKTVGGVRKQATKDFQGILDQMTKFPTSADDMTKALYDLYSTLNITGRQGIPMLQELNKAAVAGGLTAQQAGQGLLTVMSNFPKIQQNAHGAEQAFNRMFAAVRYGRMTMEELSTVLQSAAPAARQSNQSFNTLAGTLAFLSRSLGPAKAAVGFARLEEILAGPQMTTGLQSFGVSLKDANGRMLPFNEQIGILIKRFPQLLQHGAYVGNFFKTIGGLQGTIQARRAFSTIVGNVSGFRDILHKTIADNNEFSKSYTAMSRTLGVQWGVFLNTLKEIVITIGASVIPAFLEMAKPLREAVNWFQKLPQSTKDIAGRFIAFAAVGTLVIGTLAAIAAGIGVIVASIPELGGALGIIVGGAATYTFLAVVGKKIYDNWKELGPLMMKVGKDIKNILTNLGEAIMAFYHGNWDQFWSHLGDAIKAAVPGVKDALNLIMQAVIQWGRSFVTTTQGIITAAFATMFAVSRFRGRGGGAGRLLGGLSNADLMSPFLGAAGGPMGMAITAASKSDDLEKLARYVPFMNQAQKDAYSELQARQKIANSWRGQIKSVSQAITARKQLAAIDKLDQMNLTAYSRTGARAINYSTDLAKQYAMILENRQNLGITGPAARGVTEVVPASGTKFPPAADVQEALNVMNQAPGKVGAAEKAAATAAVGFEKLSGGIKSAGMSMLNFLGLGISPWIGAAVIATAAAYGLYKLMNSMPSAFDKATQGIKQFSQGLQAASTSMQDAAQSQLQINAAKLSLRQQNQQIAHYTKLVQNATVGSDSYKTAEQNLNSAQQSRVQTLHDLAQAQSNLSLELSQGSSGLANASKGLQQYLTNMPDVSGAVTSARANLTMQGGLAKPVYAQERLQTAQDQVAKLTKEGQKAIPWLNKATSALNLFVAAGGNIKTGQGAQALNNIADVMSKVYVGSTKLAGPIKTVSSLLGHVVSQQELTAFGQIPKNLIAGASEFMRIRHALPGTMTMKFLTNHQDIQRSAGALIATLGHLPSKKQITFLTNHRQFDAQIAAYIRKFHQLPDRKHMQIIIDTQQAENKLSRAQQHVAHMQTAVHQIGRIRPDINVNTSRLDRNIAKGKAEIDALDKKVTTPHSKNYNIVFHPKISQAVSDAQTLGQQLDAGVAAGITSNTVLLNNAMAAAVQGAVAAGAAKAKTGSPSKLAKDKIGDPILQGILDPLKNKSTIQGAANTAIDNMMSALQTARQNISGQLGALFAGPSFVSPTSFGTQLQQQIQWGDKVTFGALRGDLGAQVKQLGHFEKSLNRLDRRKGTKFAFIDQIRQLGPAAQSEVDALLQATPRQLRQYEKLWAKSQKLVNNTANHEVKSQVAAWKKQGAAVALGFMSGMQEYAPQMSKFFRNLFMHLFNEVKHHHKSHSPSKLYMEEGVNVMRGFQLGVMHQAHDNVRLANYFSPPVGGLRHRGPQVASVTNNYYYNRTYNVYPSKEESLLSALRKHDHITRHRP